MIKYAALLTIVLLSQALSPIAAESLWVQGPGANLCADLKACKVGDLLTVLVIEQTSSTQQASTNFKKDLNHANSAGVGPILSLIPDISISSGQSSQAQGQATMANNLITRLTVSVTELLPNGNLKVSGNRVLETNGEKQNMTLTAVVRPQDISNDNVVASTSLADVSCNYSGKGPIGNRQREGVISWLIRYIF